MATGIFGVGSKELKACYPDWGEYSHKKSKMPAPDSVRINCRMEYKAMMYPILGFSAV